MKAQKASAFVFYGNRRGIRRAAIRGFGCWMLLALLAGCTTGRGNGNGAVGVNGNDNGAAASAGNVLRYALTSEPTSLDPATVQDGTTIDLVQNIFEGLVAWDEKNQVVPNLAERWEVSSDGKTYTFFLKKGVKFHNGREVTAEDFKYSMERSCDPKTRSQTVASYLNDVVGAMDRITRRPGVTEVSGIKVVDPSTLTITIDAVKPYWLGKLTYPTSYAVCKEAIEANGGAVDEKSAIGTGPFKLESFQRGAQVVLTAFGDYHGGRPKLDSIVRPILKDANTRMSSYEAGELDILQEVSPRDLDRIESDPKLKAELKAFPRPRNWYLGLNSFPPDSPFKKRDARRAFAMAVDKDEIVRLALKGQMRPADSIVPPGFAVYESTAKPLPYDPAQAKRLLAQAGYPGGKGFPALTLSFRQDLAQVKDAAQIIASQLKTNLGLNIQLRPMEWAQFINERNNKTLPLAFLSWGADYLDPQNFLTVLLHTSKLVNGQESHPENGVGYSNPEFDRLCDLADVEQDPAKRKTLYQQAEQIALDDAPWVPIYFQTDLELIKPRVGNLRDSLLGHLPHVTTTVTP